MDLAQDGHDRTTAKTVYVDGGNSIWLIINPINTNWFDKCGLEHLTGGDNKMDFVSLLLDSDANVSASQDKFINDLSEKGIKVALVAADNKQWITPFLKPIEPETQV